jgi:hypothetical protein
VGAVFLALGFLKRAEKQRRKIAKSSPLLVHFLSMKTV